MRVAVLTLVSLTAFAGNSLLARAALRDTGIDAASFTSIRIVSGALAPWLIVRVRNDPGASAGAGSWPSAFALFAYAAAFSFAYLTLTAATGALLLFGTVQVTMIGSGRIHGERLHGVQGPGLLLAVTGLVVLLLPGLSAPPLGGAVVMIAAGFSWGVYSLRGRRVVARGQDPTVETGGNFARATPIALGLLGIAWVLPAGLHVDAAGAALAVTSGAITSGMGYAVWYSALKGLASVTAASVQLSVPVLTAVAGVALLSEPLTLRIMLASTAVVGGIAMVILARRPT